MAEPSQPQAFCTECGHALSPQYQFCLQCGQARLEGHARPDVQAPPALAQRSWRWWTGYILVLMMVGALAGGSLWSYQHRTRIESLGLGLGAQPNNSLRTYQTEFLDGDLISASVLVRSPRTGQEVAVRWLRGDEVLHTETYRLSGGRSQTRLVATRAPTERLPLGEYLLEARVGTGVPTTASFTVVPSPTPTVTGTALIADKRLPSGRSSTESQKLTFTGVVTNYTRFSDITVVWERDGTVLRTDRFEPSSGQQGNPEGIPLRFEMPRELTTHMRPGEYRVEVRVAGVPVATEQLTVQVAKLIRNPEIGTTVDSQGRVTEHIRSAREASSLYVSAYIESAPAGALISTQWFLDGEIMSHLADHYRPSTNIFNQYYYAGVITDGDYPLDPGRWQAVIWIDGQRVGSLEVVNR